MISAKPLEFKPDLSEVAKRWEANFNGDIIDRPVVCITAPKSDKKQPLPITYYDKCFGDIDEVLKRAILNAESTYYGGESIPCFCPSLGTDEVGIFVGAQLLWNNDSGDTNWAKPFVEDWRKALPLRLNKENPLWKRLIALYKKAAEKMAGKMLIGSIDLHTNMDLLMAIRGSQKLCEDLVDSPELIDLAMKDTIAIFKEIWQETVKEGRMKEYGYYNGLFSMKGAATLQCDFSAMISPSMYKKWVLPVLEEELDTVKHAVYHWDGPSALVHKDILFGIKDLYALSFVQPVGQRSIDWLDLHKEIQRNGKTTYVQGTIDEIKKIHKELKPNKVVYCMQSVNSQEAEEFLGWLNRNT